jgi:dienelactone hydrolase
MGKGGLLKLIGDFPAKCPLEPVVLLEEERGSFFQRKIEYASEVGERIRAYVLIPKTDYPRPAIFAHHQHGGDFELGKSEVVGLAGDPDQAYGKELAQRGYVVIAPDALGFEERCGSGESGDTQYREFTSRLVQGKTLNAKALHDISAAIDYLCSLPEVDPEHIGFIGHSYGGQMALWYPAFDHRIKATVSSCRCITYAESLENNIGIQMEFVIPAITQWGDLGDVIGLFQDCAAYISATNRDKYSRGAQALYRYVRSRYPATDMQLREYEGDHVFSPEMRQNAYDWLDSRLN